MDELHLLQRPPARDKAVIKTLELLNSRIPNWNSLLASSEFEGWVHDSQNQAANLRSKVRHYLS